MKKISSILIVFAIMLTSIVPTIGVNAAGQDGQKKLIDIEVFKNQQIQGWSGSEKGQLEVQNTSIPIDYNESYNGSPSARVNVTKEEENAWWTSILAFKGFCAFDLSQYVPNGFLEFNVKGKVGGEEFSIGGRDKVFERAIGESLVTSKKTKDYFTVTKEWQHVKIPLKDIMDQAKGFNAAGTVAFVINPANSKAFTVWLNDIKVTSSDNEKSYAAIKVNQVGYLTNTEKYALITGFSDKMKANVDTAFQVKNADNGNVVYSGKLVLVKEFDQANSGEKVLKADFSNLKTPGNYYIEVQAVGVDKSLKFKIGDTIYNSLLVDASRYFYYQRQGIELKAPYCTDYPREDKSPTDKNLPFASNHAITKDVSGGWYDAGDRGKYVNNSSGSISDMLWAYEIYPKSFKDNQFNIPESGNGVPDILDEARWTLEWILKMQEASSGGFYARVQGMTGEDVTDPDRFIKDKNENGNVNIKTTDDTAEAAAILAHAYIIYKNIDINFANKCLEASKKAWTFLENNPNNIMTELKIYGGYHVYDDSRDRLWASASIFRATGEERYHNYFKSNYAKLESRFKDVSSMASSWGDNWLTGFYCYLKSDGRDAAIESWFKNNYSIWLNNKMNRYKENPWQNALQEGKYFWGCNSNIMSIPQAAIIGSKLLGTYNEEIDKFARSGLNWILGVNPLGKSFVSGYGENSLNTTFNNLYSYDGKPGIPKGYLAGGPNAEQGKGLSQFPAKCFSDNDGDWTTNENCINWNAALVFAAAFVNSAPTDKDDKEIIGDVNRDGSVNIFDYVMMKKYLSGSINDFPAKDDLRTGDVNGDGKINIVDLIVVKHYLSGSITGFPKK